MKHPERIRLWVAARKARAEGDWELAGELDQQLWAEKFGSRLDSLKARLARLDAPYGDDDEQQDRPGHV
jgi:hypothetical protein